MALSVQSGREFPGGLREHRDSLRCGTARARGDHRGRRGGSEATTEPVPAGGSEVTEFAPSIPALPTFAARSGRDQPSGRKHRSLSPVRLQKISCRDSALMCAAWTAESSQPYIRDTGLPDTRPQLPGTAGCRVIRPASRWQRARSLPMRISRTAGNTAAWRSGRADRVVSFTLQTRQTGSGIRRASARIAGAGPPEAGAVTPGSTRTTARIR